MYLLITVQYSSLQMLGKDPSYMVQHCTHSVHHTAEIFSIFRTLDSKSITKLSLRCAAHREIETELENTLYRFTK